MKMMTMMALMVLATSGFAVEYKASDVPKDHAAALVYLDSVTPKTDYIEYRKVTIQMLMNLKNLKSKQEILDGVKTKLNAVNYPTDKLDIAIINMTSSILYYKYKENPKNNKSFLRDLIEFDATAEKRNVYLLLLAYWGLKEYQNVYILAIKNNKYDYAIKSLDKLGKVTEKDVNQLLSLDNNLTSKQVFYLIKLIKKQNQSNIENQTKVLKMITVLFAKFPPDVMKEGTELEWAKVQVSLSNSIEKLQKLIKINIEIERALNE